MTRILNLTLTVVLLLTSTAFADVQTLTLNTGFNHDTNAAYSLAPPKKDDFWTLFYDQAIVPTRLADIMQNHPAWKPAMLDSQWIAFAPNGVPVSNGKPQRVYVFQKCFCLKKGFENEKNFKDSILNINLRADDWAAVYLNENLTTITGTNPPSYPYLPPIALTAVQASGGGFNSNIPATANLSGKDLINRLRVGRNCLQVRLDDLGLVVSGFNLTGSLTVAGLDGVAKGTDPRTMFGNCSTCSRQRGKDFVEMQ